MGFWSKKKPRDGKADTKIAFVWSSDMQLRVAAPAGEGWKRMEASPHVDGLLAAIKCIRGTPPDALALDAYAYELPESQQLTVEQLRERDWEAHFRAKMFAEIDAVQVEIVDHVVRSGFSAQGCEVQVDGRMRQPAQPLRVRERHVPSGDKLLVASAAGTAAIHDEHKTVIDSWLAHATLGG